MAGFRQIIERLVNAKVDYVVVGGVAVILHGRPRITLDLDLVIRLDDANIRSTIRILQDFGLKPRQPVDPHDFCNPEIRRQWIEQRGMLVLSFFDPTSATAGVDVFAQYPMDYDLLVAQSIVGDLEGIEIRYCGLDHLIEMKKIAGRKIDLSDVEELEIIRDAKNKSRG